MTDWSAGPAAGQIGDLFWTMMVLGGIIFALIGFMIALSPNRRGA